MGGPEEQRPPPQEFCAKALADHGFLLVTPAGFKPALPPWEGSHDARSVTSGRSIHLLSWSAQVRGVLLEAVVASVVANL